MKGKKIKDYKQEEFIVMNSQLEYFAGLAYGGQLIWSKDYVDCKPLDHINKYNTIKRMCKGEEIVLDYI